MLLHHSQPPSIKLEDRLVYPHTSTPSQFAPYSNSLGDTVIAWDCYSSNNINNSNITINNDHNNNNITTLDYYINNNTNNTNNHNNIFNNNHTNETNITNNFILNLDRPLHASSTNTTNSNSNNNNNTTQSGFQFNIPIFLSQIKEEIPEQQHSTTHHHRQHHHQQQQQHQHHQRQQHQTHYSTTTVSSQYPSPHTIANFVTMPTKKSKTAAAALAAMPKPPPLPHNASQSNPATSSPLSTASSQQQQQSTTVLPLSSLPSLSSSTTPPSPSSSSSSRPMKFSVSSSISTSSSTSSSPPSSPPPSSSPLSYTPSSFTETSYSTSDDKLYLVNNFTPESIVSTMSSSSDHHPNHHHHHHKNAKMINMINNYNADALKTTINDMSENNNFDLSYSNSFGLFGEGLDSDRILQRIPLPDIWTTFGHPSPKDTTCSASDVSDSMIVSDLLEPFETLQDVQLACPFGEDIDTTFFSSMETSCSEGDEEGSHITSDCGYSSDHTTTQPSPISNESSNDWSGSFNNKLPVFEELQVSNREEEKRRPKRSTPSPGQKKKSKDSSNPNEKERKKPGRKPGQVSNVLHLWEFMRDLLHDPTISDGIIQWVSKSEGVFRVVDSSAVARLWGQKKNNKKEMTYEKLSRSLRYSRLEGYFDNLPKDKNYPKKLCFKFGPKSRHFSTLQGSTASPVNIDH